MSRDLVQRELPLTLHDCAGIPRLSGRASDFHAFEIVSDVIFATGSTAHRSKVKR